MFAVVGIRMEVGVTGEKAGHGTNETGSAGNEEGDMVVWSSIPCSVREGLAPSELPPGRLETGTDVEPEWEDIAPFLLAAPGLIMDDTVDVSSLMEGRSKRANNAANCCEARRLRR